MLRSNLVTFSSRQEKSSQPCVLLRKTHLDVSVLKHKKGKKRRERKKNRGGRGKVNYGLEPRSGAVKRNRTPASVRNRKAGPEAEPVPDAVKHAEFLARGWCWGRFAFQIKCENKPSGPGHSFTPFPLFQHLSEGAKDSCVSSQAPRGENDRWEGPSKWAGDRVRMHMQTCSHA